MNRKDEKQRGVPYPPFQIQLLDLLVMTLMLGVALGLFMPHQLNDEDATARQWVSFLLCFAVPAFLMLIISVRYCNSIPENSAGRVRHGIGLQVLGWVVGGIAMVPVLGVGLGRGHSYEIPAAAAVKAIAESETIYKRTDYDKDGVKEYAPSLLDLLETVPGTGNLLLVDPALADAEGLPAAAPKPKVGYCFVILQAQGPNAPGGAKSYIDASGNLTGGFAVLAYPATYDPKARRYARYCYLISEIGTIYMRDLGPQTLTIVPTITTFDPDTNWKPCE